MQFAVSIAELGKTKRQESGQETSIVANSVTGGIVTLVWAETRS